MRVVLVVLLVLLSASPAQAATGTYLRLGHLSPETGRVDITLTPAAKPDAAVRLENIEYGSMLDYRLIDAGAHEIALRPAGDRNAAPVASATLQAVAGKAYTVVDLNKQGKVLEDDISLPPSGQARLRVVNAAPPASQLDVVRDEKAVVGDVAYGAVSDYVPFAPGAAIMQVRPDGGEAVNLEAFVEAGGVYSVLVVERGGKLSASMLADARANQVTPGGSQETGFGGMAPGGPGLDWRMIALTSLLVVAGMTVFRRRLFRFE